MSISKEESQSTLTLRSGKVLSYYICGSGNDGWTRQIEFMGENMFLMVVAKSDCTPDGEEDCRMNSGFETESFLVSEYIGSESQSDNWSPDIFCNGLTDEEIEEVLVMFEVGEFDNS